MGPVASLLAMDRTTLTAALKPLERRGLVRICNDPSDRRSRVLFLTEKGRMLLAQALPVWQRTHEDIEGATSAVDWDCLRKNLRAIS